jgi:transcriptional regulator with XRE-family HTH domain
MKNNLQKLIDKKFKSQVEFARALKIPPTRISQWKSGKFPIPLKGDIPERMCKLLSCKLQDLGIDPAEYDKHKNTHRNLILAAKLLAHIEKNKITQEQIAQNFKTSKDERSSKQYINQIIDFNLNMSRTQMERIAEASGTTLEELEKMEEPEEKRLLSARRQIKENITQEEESSFLEIWRDAKENTQTCEASPKIIIVEDVLEQNILCRHIVKSKIRQYAKLADNFNANEILIQPYDKIKVAVSSINGEGNDAKLALIDMNLFDTDNSLEYLEENLTNKDCKIVILSAISDQEEIERIKNHPLVYDFIEKGVETTNILSVVDDLLIEIIKEINESNKSKMQ